MTNPETDFAKPLAGAIGAVILFVGFSIWGRRRGLKLLQGWAEAQGFVLVSASRRTFVPHWPLESGKGYQFFRVTVREKNGTIRKGWVRCGEFGGNDLDQTDVIWDEA